MGTTTGEREQQNKSCKGPSSDRPYLTLATLKQCSPVHKGPQHWQTLPETHGSSTMQPSCKGPLWRPICPVHALRTPLVQQKFSILQVNASTATGTQLCALPAVCNLHHHQQLLRWRFWQIGRHETPTWPQKGTKSRGWKKGKRKDSGMMLARRLQRLTVTIATLDRVPPLTYCPHRAKWAIDNPTEQGLHSIRASTFSIFQGSKALGAFTPISSPMPASIGVMSRQGTIDKAHSGPSITTSCHYQ
ncbi:hypothetical protein QQF64_022191 [Cirrhinus molitorella]|uniref:Uncharacterized protein n=1 Tax=Cirrhinus molitorella TaxID=172907 RepID=A0ABR3L7M8_9TELE